MGIKFLQNIDAERNKFEEAGFDVVDALPTTNLFIGRQVTYNGRNYVYNGKTWIDLYNPAPRFVEPYPYIMTTEELTHGTTAIGGTVDIQLLNSISSSLLSIIDDVSGDNYLIEINDGSGWSVVNGSVIIYRRIPVGSSIRYTAFKDMNQSPVSLGYFFAVYKNGNYRLKTTSRYDIEFYYPNDNGVAHWKTVYSQQFDKDEGNYWFFPVQKYWRLGTSSNQEITNARITITTISSTDASFPETVVSGIKFLTNRQLTSKTTPVYINYDALIKPTQSSKTYKTIEWVLQYLIQGVNWLRDRYLPIAGGTMTGNLTVPKLIKSGGSATHMLMADGSTKDVSEFASSEDIPTQLHNPNPFIIKTADEVSVRYDGSTIGRVILEAGDNAEVTATQDSDDTMTVKFGAVVPQTLPNPNALNITVLDSERALLGPSMVYDGVAAKYFKLIEGYGIRLSNSNLSNSNSHEVTINLKQIAGTTLLGNANGTTDIPQAITMAQLRTMLGSLTLNDISVTLGGNSSYTLPCYIDYADTRYLCRISSDATGLQIYRNGVWATIGKFCQCNTRGTITNSNIDSWYEDTVSNYELDESLSAALFAEDLTTNFGTSMAGAWTGKTVTLNLTSVSIKDTKSAWEMLKKNMGDCFPHDSVEKIRYYYNVAIPSGEVVTKIELSYNKGVGMCTVHFYMEG